MQKVITDDLEAILNVLPPHIRLPLLQQADLSELLEVVIDLGRTPEARFAHREMVISEQEISEQDIDYVVARVGSFGDDNRAGIERTLHRISAIRNRKGRIVGLTCRIGRAVFGTIQIIKDLVESGKSLLLLGAPGVGKTTMLREIARVVADDLKKRVIVVDTSNEIAGDGDIPHPAIGHARRMQVPTPTMQHAVMIEAVENHMPEVIVIDEIGTELETQAARTIAERGVQLVGTAHGNTLENLMMNPTLADLIGGIQSVTLSDEEAKRRGTQKSILERKSAPTFHIVIEIQDWAKVAVHPDVGDAVDSILRGQPADTETRSMDEKGELQIVREETIHTDRPTAGRPAASAAAVAAPEGKHLKLFLYGVNHGRLEEVTKEAHIPLEIVSSLEDADLFITSKNYFRTRPQKVREAEAVNVPIYVLRGNTPAQMRQLIQTIYPSYSDKRDAVGPLKHALDEAEQAVDQLRNGEKSVELSPQSAYIRRLQHLIAERHHLSSQSTGKEPHRRVRMFTE